jgi:hypothetical protein
MGKRIDTGIVCALGRIVEVLGTTLRSTDSVVHLSEDVGIHCFPCVEVSLQRQLRALRTH